MMRLQIFDHILAQGLCLLNVIHAEDLDEVNSHPQTNRNIFTARDIESSKARDLRTTSDEFAIGSLGRRTLRKTIEAIKNNSDIFLASNAQAPFKVGTLPASWLSEAPRV